MTSKSRNSRVILAIPEASNRHWNDGRKEGESKEDDVAFLDAIVLAVSNRFPVDRKRVCATGISNGALLSFRLACERSETYSAIIPVAAHLGRELSLHCRPSRPVSILHIAGTLDPLVPVGGGQITGPFGFRKRGEVLSAEATLRFWEERNRNFPEGRAEIRQVLLPDAGHAWPGGWAYLSETLIGPTPPTPDASGMALRFCIDHPKVDQYEASDHIFSNRPR
jgi:polyhydroxybutyrate depolymerase